MLGIRSLNRYFAHSRRGFWAIAVLALSPALGVEAVTFSLSPSSLHFSSPAPGTNPPTQVVVISNIGSGNTVSWTCYAPNWISLSNTSGVVATGSSQTIQISVSAAGFVGGTTQQGVLIFSDANAPSDTPQSIPVVYTIGGTSGGAPVATSNTSVTVYPNPWRKDKNASSRFITFVPVPDGGSVQLFTLSGRQVKKVAGSNGSAIWDLTNSHGSLAASGLYLYVVDDGHGNQSRGKVAIVR